MVQYNKDKKEYDDHSERFDKFYAPYNWIITVKGIKRLIVELLQIDRLGQRVQKSLTETNLSPPKAIESYLSDRLITTVSNYPKNKDAALSFYSNYYKKIMDMNDVASFQKEEGYKVLVSYIEMHSVSIATGSGLVYSGGGIYEPVVPKYHIDIDTLRFQSLLEIRYTKNKHLSTIRPVTVSKKLKKVILDFLADKKFNVDEFKKLDSQDRDLLRGASKYIGLKIDENEDSDNEEYAKKWEAVLGELQSGNDNPRLKKEAKLMLQYAYNTGRITLKNMTSIINSLDL